MSIQYKNSPDIEVLLSHAHDQGADLWATPEGSLITGAPFSTLDCALMLVELGLMPEDPLMQGLSERFFSVWQNDGRFKLYPKGSIFPCQTALAAKALCAMGYVQDPRVQKTLSHLLSIQQPDGGWRCNKFYFGRGPETEYSNPYPTLTALNAFRYSAYLNREPALDRAVEFLLQHWRIRKPIGPCHYGIGTLFMQVEYPFRNYNLFEYVYVLSFYGHAKTDERFLEAFEALRARTVDGQIVVQRVVPKLAKLSFCQKGAPSEFATRRYREILQNLGLES